MHLKSPVGWILMDCWGLPDLIPLFSSKKFAYVVVSSPSSTTIPTLLTSSSASTLCPWQLDNTNNATKDRGTCPNVILNGLVWNTLLKLGELKQPIFWNYWEKTDQTTSGKKMWRRRRNKSSFRAISNFFSSGHRNVTNGNLACCRLTTFGQLKSLLRPYRSF